MARFLYWSDLHNELWEGFDLPDMDTPIDGVLIGGDTDTQGRHLDIPAAAARKYRCPVVAILGNHEIYGAIWSELLEYESKQLAKLHEEGLDVRVLRGTATEIAGIRIVGATLWTDLKLYPKQEIASRMAASAFMQDYRVIRMAAGKKFTPDDMLMQHHQDKAAVLNTVGTSHVGPTIVMTHHLPVRQLVSKWRDHETNPERPLNASFASDLWSEIKSSHVDIWLCGHSHDNNTWTGQGDHGDIRFLMNGRGYPHEKTEFDPAFIVSA